MSSELRPFLVGLFHSQNGSVFISATVQRVFTILADCDHEVKSVNSPEKVLFRLVWVCQVNPENGRVTINLIRIQKLPFILMLTFIINSVMMHCI